MSDMTPKEQRAYDMAVARIAQAEREGGMKLDLSNLGLTELPPEIGRLTGLRVLNLRDNRLTAVPDWMGELTQLQSLDLDHNELTAVPDSLRELTQLQYLHLDYNQLTAVPDSLRELTQLHLLGLGNNQLTAVPDSLRELTQLQYLGLGNNQLTAVPDSLRELTQLQYLHLDYNQLTAVPDWMGELTQLHSLGLIGNRLTAVPDSLRELTQLHSLDLRDNQLTAVPDSLRELTQLHSLALSGNQLTAVPDSLRELTQLQSLDLSDNRLTAVPDSLRELTQLQYLRLEYNQLTAVPDWMAEMPALKTLFIWGNPITQPPPEQLGEALTELFEPVDLDALRRYFAIKKRDAGIKEGSGDQLVMDNLAAAPKKLEKVLDSAIKREITVGESTVVLVLIRDPDSKGLRFLLNIEPDYLLEEEDVRSSRVFQLNYPVDKFGNLLPTDVEIVIVSPDFHPMWQSEIVSLVPDQHNHYVARLMNGKQIFTDTADKRGFLTRLAANIRAVFAYPRPTLKRAKVVQDDDLNPIEFMLTPLMTGELKIIVEVYQAPEGKRIKIGSKPMHTLSKENLSPYTNYRVSTLTLYAYGVNPQLPEARTEITNIFNAPVQQGEGGIMNNTIDNRGSGDNITTGDISSSSGVAIGSGAVSTVYNSTAGDTFNMSGDFRGANVNIKSRLENVQQTIGALPHADEAAKAELQQLIAQLNDALQEAPEDKAEEAEAVAQMAETLVETANSEKPNKMMVEITGDGLKKAAENVAAVMPTVLVIAMQIVTAVANLVR